MWKTLKSLINNKPKYNSTSIVENDVDISENIENAFNEYFLWSIENIVKDLTSVEFVVSENTLFVNQAVNSGNFLYNSKEISFSNLKSISFEQQNKFSEDEKSEI